MKIKAALLEAVGTSPAVRTIDLRQPSPYQVVVKIEACAVCRTDLHVIDGDLPNPKLPLVLGHEIVGVIESAATAVDNLKVGDRVGIPWLARTCMECEYCRNGKENLCDKAVFTGYTTDGGFAEYTIADARFCFPIPPEYDAAHAAPFLCAGLIGWRSLKLAGDAINIGIYGFGAAAHVVTPIAINEGKRVFAFTSAGDASRQQFAESLGAVWAGDSNQQPPEELDAAIIFAPVGALVPTALRAVRKGGTVVCGGIHMSDIPSFPYSILWGERSIRSVANLTRADGVEFFERVRRTRIDTHITPYALDEAPSAIRDFRSGKIKGAAVIVF